MNPITTSIARKVGRPLSLSHKSGGALIVAINRDSSIGTINGLATFIPATTMTNAARINMVLRVVLELEAFNLVNISFANNLQSIRAVRIIVICYTVAIEFSGQLQEYKREMTAATSSIEMITDLVGFDTTSRNSNLELIEFVKGYLEQFGIASELVFDDERRKANLFATIGATDRGGVALSGHTDVVPVDGQKWDTDPYEINRTDDRLFGRGTCDMKSFIAVCLAKVPQIVEKNLETPIHFAFSYDEEIGCVGVRTLLRELEQRPNKPRLCVIGEPTGMRVVRAHKGKISRRCTIHGLEAHSGLAHIGVNAVEAVAEIIAFLKGFARMFRDEGPFDYEFDPPYTTVHTGTVKGGTALNIVPKLCTFETEIRHLPNDDPDLIWNQLHEFIDNEILPEMQAVYPEASIVWEEISIIPALSTSDKKLIQMTQELSNTTGTGCVSFGTEGGLFEDIGIPSVVCGPGYIDQAHKPNEYIDISQIQKCEQFVDNLLERLN